MPSCASIRRYYDRDADWWYGYFILGRNRGEVTGPIDLGIADYADSRAYINAVYRRGLVFLNDIRKLIGTETLDAAMKDYYQSQEYKIATQDAFFDALARHTSEDIGPLVKGYFAGDVALPCRISANAPGCRR